MAHSGAENDFDRKAKSIMAADLKILLCSCALVVDFQFINGYDESGDDS